MSLRKTWEEKIPKDFDPNKILHEFRVPSQTLNPHWNKSFCFDNEMIGDFEKFGGDELTLLRQCSLPNFNGELYYYFRDICFMDMSVIDQKFQGGVLYNPINEMNSNKVYYTSQERLKLLQEWVVTIHRKNNQWKSLMIDTRFVAEAGGSIDQELSFFTGYLFFLCKEFEKSSLSLTEFLSKIVIDISVNENFYFSLAKVKAYKEIWNQCCESWGVELPPVIRAHSLKRSFSTLDSWGNYLRQSIMMMSAVLGGASSLYPVCSDYLVNPNPDKTLPWQMLNLLKDEANLSEMSQSAYTLNLTEQLVERAFDKSKSFSWKNFSKEVYSHHIKEQKEFYMGKKNFVGTNLYPEKPFSKEVFEDDVPLKKSKNSILNLNGIKAERFQEWRPLFPPRRLAKSYEELAINIQEFSGIPKVCNEDLSDNLITSIGGVSESKNFDLKLGESKCSK